MSFVLFETPICELGNFRVAILKCVVRSREQGSQQYTDDDGSVNERSSSSLFLVQYYIINQSSSPFPRILSRWGESTITARRKEQEGGARQRHRRQDERITYYSTSLHYPVAPGQKKKVKK